MNQPVNYPPSATGSRESCTLQYIKIDQVADAAIQQKQGAELGKIDAKSAYRVVPVHPSDRPLLGMRWEGREYIASALPFGLRSAPKIFNLLAQ